jgi:stage V sporulation protein G
VNITEVRVKLMRNRTDRLRAFCSVTIDDDFVVHDLRVIEGRKGFFVAMPSRKLADNCPRCGSKNELRSKFCGDCGARLDQGRQRAAKRDKVHVDVAHPINTACREMLQERVLAAYQEEAAKGGEEPAAGSEEEYYAETAYVEPEATDQYYEEEAVAEADAEAEVEIAMEVLSAIEEVEEALEEEEEAPFPLEAPRADILEKEEEVGNLVESALAEEGDFVETLEEIQEVEESAPAAPPAAPEEAEEEERPGKPSEERPLRRRPTRRGGPSGGFGEGIL